MSKNRSGFTMIELLAAVVILGIMMGIAIPVTMSVLQDQRNNTYVQDAIRLASNMDYKMRSDNKTPVPARGTCIAMNLTYLDNNTFNEAPYDGEYDRLASFVVARRNIDPTSDTEYFYYVRLIEKTKTGAYRGVDLLPVDDDNNSATGTEYLYMTNAKDKCVSNLAEGDAKSLTSYIEYEDLLLAMLGNAGISCEDEEGNANVIIYAPDASDGV